MFVSDVQLMESPRPLSLTSLIRLYRFQDRENIFLPGSLYLAVNNPLKSRLAIRNRKVVTTPDLAVIEFNQRAKKVIEDTVEIVNRISNQEAPSNVRLLDHLKSVVGLPCFRVVIWNGRIRITPVVGG